MPRFVEVSHVIEPGMVTYPGLPVPQAEVIIDHDTSRERYQNKSEFLIASLHLCGNTGTYVDSRSIDIAARSISPGCRSNVSRTCPCVSSMRARTVAPSVASSSQARMCGARRCW